MLLSIGQLNLTTALTNEELMLIFSLKQNLINQFDLLVLLVLALLSPFT